MVKGRIMSCPVVVRNDWAIISGCYFGAVGYFASVQSCQAPLLVIPFKE
jgi:hypothetical protein